jgi:hypothetical protein
MRLFGHIRVSNSDVLIVQLNVGGARGESSAKHAELWIGVEAP